MKSFIFLFFVLFLGLPTSPALSQQENNLFIGGTASLNFISSKPITNSPWDEATNRYFISIKPELGLASADGSSFFGFGLGISLSKGMNFNADERFIGALVGGYYRKVVLLKSPILPFFEAGLDVIIGQYKIQQASSDFFGSILYSRVGLMYAPESKWRMLFGMNFFSLQYDRYSSNQVFRAGLHNIGSLNISIIRLF
jgi:hypothetical protein